MLALESLGLDPFATCQSEAIASCRDQGVEYTDARFDSCYYAYVGQNCPEMVAPPVPPESVSPSSRVGVKTLAWTIAGIGVLAALSAALIARQ